MVVNPMSLPEDEREQRLTLIRAEAERQGRVDAPGVRPPGAPFPHADSEHGYYGVPLLKRPAWTWEIPLYFFVGGAAGSSAVIATFAEWLGGDRRLARDARWVALGGVGLSTVLLVSDLGRPERFLAMLRVLKLQSPMSVGAWILNVFGSTTTAAVFADLIRDRYGDSIPIQIIGAGSKALSMLSGLPFSNYTGVLIGATAIPVWNRNVKTLPLHFGASGVEAGVSILELIGHSDDSALNMLGIGSAFWETWEGIQIEKSSDHELDPLKHGHSGWITRAGGVLSGPLALGLRVLAAYSGKQRSRKFRRAAAVSGVLGSLLTRYGWMRAGHQSAKRSTGLTKT